MQALKRFDTKPSANPVPQDSHYQRQIKGVRKARHQTPHLALISYMYFDFFWGKI
jgi:hypothetical protein